MSIENSWTFSADGNEFVIQVTDNSSQCPNRYQKKYAEWNSGTYTLHIGIRDGVDQLELVAGEVQFLDDRRRILVTQALGMLDQIEGNSDLLSRITQKKSQLHCDDALLQA